MRLRNFGGKDRGKATELRSYGGTSDKRQATEGRF